MNVIKFVRSINVHSYCFTRLLFAQLCRLPSRLLHSRHSHSDWPIYIIITRRRGRRSIITAVVVVAIFFRPSVYRSYSRLGILFLAFTSRPPCDNIPPGSSLTGNDACDRYRNASGYVRIVILSPLQYTERSNNENNSR